jgi:hypothetical protein
MKRSHASGEGFPKRLTLVGSSSSMFFKFSFLFPSMREEYRTEHVI